MIKIWNQQTVILVNSELRHNVLNAINYVLKRINSSANKFRYNIIFVDNKEIRKLNSKFLKCNDITDVLSFCYDSTQADIYISIEQCSIQAKELNEPFARELYRLVIHGILHSLGWKDYNNSHRAKMWKLQESIVTSFCEELKKT